jgi:dipeptidyl aminopeptidase/acylaminoacyl peptidase
MFNGEMSKGILYKPENFDSTKKYPVIFNYYEAMSHLMYEFPEAGYSGGNINIPWFVSRGYLVFNPDIYFKPAKSSNKTVGEWAFNSVVSAAKYLSRFSFIDSTKMAIQGHSFGGLETSYLVTHTNIFAAAAEAAGSTDPISAYLTLVPLVSSIEHFTKQAAIETGHELYESTPWERKDLWLRNSAVLNADKVTTPLLIMHCMKDNQVQWRQGVELFMALRRLHKKVWMLQYDNGNHGVFGRDAIDYTKRLTQFFDHYLKDSPPPIWMTKGVPSKLKGLDNGFKYDVRL